MGNPELVECTIIFRKVSEASMKRRTWTTFVCKILMSVMLLCLEDSPRCYHLLMNAQLSKRITEPQ